MTKRATPPQEIAKAVIAPRPARRRRASAFQAYVWLSSVVFVVLAVGAHFVPYFRVDLAISRAVQTLDVPGFAGLMFGLSWIGYGPQAYWIAGSSILLLFGIGLRWEGVSALFAAVGPFFGMVVKLIVYRPRPTEDLIQVARVLNSTAFPSGHVLSITIIGGFCFFLVYTLLKPSWVRTTLLVVLGPMIGLMGLSRIHQGAHWFSDVMGAYLLGSLWLALTIKVYRWGKPRFFVRQPLASGSPTEKPSV